MTNYKNVTGGTESKFFIEFYNRYFNIKSKELTYNP